MAREMKLNVGINNWEHGCNILDLDVPPQLERKVRSKVTWWDEAVGEGGSAHGITPSTCAIVTGTPGAGKTTAMLQVADALTSQGHFVLFNTAEESLYQVRKVAKRLRLMNGFYAGQDHQVTDIIAHADKLRKLAKGKKSKDGKPAQVIVICDSLQTLDDGKYGNGGRTGNTPVRAIEMLAEWCKRTYGIVIVIGQVTKDGRIAGKNQVKHTVDVHAHLAIDVDSKSETYGERLFEVQKNRFGVSGTCFVLGMDGGRGLYEKGRLTYQGFGEDSEDK